MKIGRGSLPEVYCSPGYTSGSGKCTPSWRVETRRGTHGGVSDREATVVQSLQTELTIVYFRGERYVHRLKVRMFLDFDNVGQTGIRAFPQKLSISVRAQDWLDGGTKKTYLVH